MICYSISMKAQDVYIPVPANNIFNRTELNTVQNILNTRNHENWRIGWFAPIWPEIQSTSGDNFGHRTIVGATIPTTVLLWQLKSIGGQLAPFRNGDNWPMPYKWFSSSSQYWYQPRSTNGGYNAGNVAFNFKIPSDKYLGYAYHAGEYSIGITHNYGSSGYTIEFTPNSLNTILSIPAAITWISNTPSKYIEISELNQYRSGGTRIISDLGTSEIANTLDFNLMAKAAASTIQFTSSKGATGTRPVSLVKLGSTNSKITTLPLSATSQNYSPTNNFKVEVGNRNNFALQLSISNTDFKNHFFEAGAYTFQLNMNANSTDNTVSSPQNTDIILKVLPLSEIKIPNSGNAVNFVFNTFSHYNDGQTKIAPNQIKISNNETYELYVKSDASFFNKSGIQSDVPSSILQIGVDGGSQNIPLTTTSKPIITNGTPVLDKDLNIKYTISSAAAKTLVAKEKSTYSINVIYSFTAL